MKWSRCRHGRDRIYRMQKNFLLPPMYFVVQSTPMNEQERAEEHLRTIRRLMERATIYRAISAPTALVGGLLSLVASAVYPHIAHAGSRYVHRRFPAHLPLGLAAGSATHRFDQYPVHRSGSQKAQRAGIFRIHESGSHCAAPPFFLAATLPSSGEWNPDWDFDISVIWAICYGLGLLATSHFAPRSLMLLGWAFLLAGIAGILVSEFILIGLAT